MRRAGHDINSLLASRPSPVRVLALTTSRSAQILYSKPAWTLYRIGTTRPVSDYAGRYPLLQGYCSDMKRMKPALALSCLRAASAITQVTNCFIVSLRLGAGVGRQIFDPPGFKRSVWTTPWANPLQKLSRAALPGLTGLAEQATARSPAVLMLILTGGAFGGAAAAGNAQVNAKMMIGRMP
jgi:hypothetical protein